MDYLKGANGFGKTGLKVVGKKQKRKQKVKIKTNETKELNYDELLDIEQINTGDMLLVKEPDSNKWLAQFITLVTNMGIYLNPDNTLLDGGGIILWPEYIKKPKTYSGYKFIHLSINESKITNQK